MGASFTGEQILAITKGELVGGSLTDLERAIAIDPRTIRAGEWYLALQDEKYDGHEFVGTAYKGGALGAIVSKRPKHKSDLGNFALIHVTDAPAAYRAMAHYWRMKVAPRVVAIAGGRGKSAVKEMCVSVLKTRFRCHASRANENNSLGISKTLLDMDEATEVLVVEVAIRRNGQARPLVQLLKPDVAIITDVGTTGTEGVHAIEAMARARCELLEGLDANWAVAILGEDSQPLAHAAQRCFNGLTVSPGESLRLEGFDSSGTIFKSDGCLYKVNAYSEDQIRNAWSAANAGIALGLTPEVVAQGLQDYLPSDATVAVNPPAPAEAALTPGSAGLAVQSDRVGPAVPAGLPV